MQSAESLRENVEARDGAVTAQEILSEIFSLAGKDVVGFTTLAGRTVRIELSNGQKFTVTVTEEK